MFFTGIFTAATFLNPLNEALCTFLQQDVFFLLSVAIPGAWVYRKKKMCFLIRKKYQEIKRLHCKESPNKKFKQSSSSIYILLDVLLITQWV